MDVVESDVSNFLNRYVEPYLFPVMSACVLALIGLIVLHLNSTFMGSRTVTISTVLILGAIWGLMMWINYGKMTLKTVMQIVMAIVLMTTIYFFVMFELAGRDCTQDMALWPMLKSIL